MRISKSFILLLSVFAVFGLTACEKLIELKVPNADPVIVVESSISTDTVFWEVSLTWSQQYFNQAQRKYVDDAIVTITDNIGGHDTLFYSDTGVYVSRYRRFCIPGREYTLNIYRDGKTYSATELCKFQDPIDFLMSFYLPDQNGFIEAGYYVFEKANEIETSGDYYQWKIYQNDTLKKGFGYLLDEDEFRETSFFNLNIDPNDPLKDMDRNILPRPFPFKFEVGDTVRIEQYNISKAYYDFLNELERQISRSGTPFDPPPTNPNYNISNGAIGFFSVSNVSKAKIVVQE
ncbi:MAG: DUF4249 family protein [Bacteroidetes bacterium]|nr:DUF4249 family protein [Bacteroidota bacterium]